MSISFSNILSYLADSHDFNGFGISVPVSVDVAGFTTLTVEISDKRDFTTPVEVLDSTGGNVTRANAGTVTVNTPIFGGAFVDYSDKFFKIKRNGVVIARGEFLNYRTAAKAARRRRR